MQLNFSRHAAEVTMLDLIFLAVSAAFFGVAIAYVMGCEALRGAKHD